MPGVAVFNEHAEEYDRWFEEHSRAYHAEVNALRRFVPRTGLGVEIGAGTGRFAVPLGVSIGVEPARGMAERASRRGVSVVQALGEQLPFHAAQFDWAVLVTAICFVTDVATLLREVHRVLRAGGWLINAFIDRDSALGRVYESRKAAHTFYRHAHFYSAAEVATWTRQAGFGGLRFCQTILGFPDDSQRTYEVRDGYGEGAFVVLSAERRSPLLPAPYRHGGDKAGAAY